jgi:hypothetical protein
MTITWGKNLEVHNWIKKSKKTTILVNMVDMYPCNRRKATHNGPAKPMP